MRWIRQKVVLALEVSPESFDEHFTDSLERARSAGIAREQLLDYLSDKHGQGSAVFFSANSWAEDIEGETPALPRFVVHPVTPSIYLAV